MNAARNHSIIWATRGRDWGFRFLLDAGLDDPLPEYECAFEGLEDAPDAWRQIGRCVALRFPDPLGRRDAAGRVIPHEFVLFDSDTQGVESVADGLNKVWPLVSETYAHIWDMPDPLNT